MNENPVTFNSIPDSVVIDPGLGIENSSALDGIFIYPNPVNDHLLIRSQYEIIKRIELFDISGRKVLTSKPMSNQISIPVEQLSAGMYTVFVICNKKVFHKKTQITDYQ